MSFIKAAGSVLSIASAYGSSITMSAISNAADAVATLAGGHGIIVGDILEITSGWPKADKRLVRVSAVATDDVTLEDLDTSSTANFPAGSGTGSVRKVSTWTPIAQVAADVQVSGGEQQFTTLRLLSQEDEINIPTTRSAVTATLPVYFDPSQASITAVRTARDAGGVPYGFKWDYPGTPVSYGNAYWGIPDIATVRDGLLSVDITLSFAAQPILYAS